MAAKILAKSALRPARKPPSPPSSAEPLRSYAPDDVGPIDRTKNGPHELSVSSHLGMARAQLAKITERIEAATELLVIADEEGDFKWSEDKEYAGAAERLLTIHVRKLKGIHEHLGCAQRLAFEDEQGVAAHSSPTTSARKKQAAAV